jgi:hypothetical protein
MGVASPILRTIRVVSRNYDGRLRDEYEAFLWDV